MTDPIGDLLARIRNAHLALHAETLVPKSRVKESMVALLKEEGFIDDFGADEANISITLKYAKGKPAIRGLKRVSVPGRRVYVKATDIPRVLNGLGICILSTSHGIMSGENAREANVGGELLCEVW